MPGRLTVVGLGIGLSAHVTYEAQQALRHADRVFHLAGEVVQGLWVQQQNPQATALDDCYAEGTARKDTYAEMTRRIIQAVREGHHVVAAFYGHPGIGVDAAHAAIAQARAEGFEATMQPGVSAGDCLVADLGIDPFTTGWQAHEAWRFVESRPRFEPTCPLVLWQIGLVYQSSINFDAKPNRRGLRAITATLLETYASTHEVVLYEASPYPITSSRLEHLPLSALPKADVNFGTTLYVPPRATRRRPARRTKTR